jgi:predicted nucleotidyltransferase
MRLAPEQIKIIHDSALAIAGPHARVRLFGSRLDDTALGGDVDLLLEIDEVVTEPALMAARFAAAVSRSMQGRKIDVVILAPNLMKLPIHTHAVNHGVLL